VADTRHYGWGAVQRSGTQAGDLRSIGDPEIVEALPMAQRRDIDMEESGDDRGIHPVLSRPAHHGARPSSHRRFELAAR